MLQPLPAILGTCLLLALTGCGTEGPPTYRVSGRVTYDGAAIAQGEIIFRDSTGPSHAGKIINGDYNLQTTAGNKRVEITSSGVVGGEARSASGEPDIQLAVQIPPQYNENSELSANVTADGANAFDFDLTP